MPQTWRPASNGHRVGIGGTASTLLLSHAELAVTLLEKNTLLGGACAGYEKQASTLISAPIRLVVARRSLGECCAARP